MIQYMPLEKTRRQGTLEKLLNSAAKGWSADPMKRIQEDADAIATAMALLHGGDWRVQIDHDEGFLLIVRRGRRQTL